MSPSASPSPSPPITMAVPVPFSAPSAVPVRPRSKEPAGSKVYVRVQGACPGPSARPRRHSLPAAVIRLLLYVCCLYLSSVCLCLSLSVVGYRLSVVVCLCRLSSLGSACRLFVACSHSSSAKSAMEKVVGKIYFGNLLHVRCNQDKHRLRKRRDTDRETEKPTKRRLAGQ